MKQWIQKKERTWQANWNNHKVVFNRNLNNCNTIRQEQCIRNWPFDINNSNRSKMIFNLWIRAPSSKDQLGKRQIDQTHIAIRFQIRSQITHHLIRDNKISRLNYLRVLLSQKRKMRTIFQVIIHCLLKNDHLKERRALKQAPRSAYWISLLGSRSSIQWK